MIRKFADSLSRDKYILLYLSDSKLTPSWLYKGMLRQLGLEPKFYRSEAKDQLQNEIRRIRANDKVTIQSCCFKARKIRCHPERSEAESRDLMLWMVTLSSRSLHSVSLSLHSGRDDNVVSHFKASRLNSYTTRRKSSVSWTRRICLTRKPWKNFGSC